MKKVRDYAGREMTQLYLHSSGFSKGHTGCSVNTELKEDKSPKDSY